MKLFSTAILFFIFCLHTAAQTERPFIKLVQPTKEANTVTAARQFISGSTCKSCTINVNSQPVKVYPSGGFAAGLTLNPGDTAINIVATNSAGATANRTLAYHFAVPTPPQSVAVFGIDRIQTFPDGNLVLLPGDKIRFRVKAFPGADLRTFANTKLFELPASQAGIAGIYQGEYVVKPGDSFTALHFPLTLKTDSQTVTKETPNAFSVMSPLSSDVCETKGRLAHLLYGLGDDRLGGAKIGYVDSLIPLRIIGKVNNLFKVALTPYRSAYIPDDVVDLMPKGTFAGEALTDRWEVFGDSLFDYVRIRLTAKLPYESLQEIDPSRIVLDIFGAVCNTNWITQLASAQEIKNVDYEQTAEGVLRVNIWLKHKQFWGHSIYYDGNLLVIRVKRPPTALQLRGLKIAVDAGHGGSNTGAGGPTGVAEKDLTLAVSLQLQAALQQEGVNVLMTRTAEKFVDNHDRILMYRDDAPDLLVSIHMNSSEDPINVAGDATFYRYIGFRPLSYAIHRRLLELGLKDAGNNGSFNFMLNSPTEYPNALVETLYLSNPAEEAQILDPAFQKQVADKIVAGIKDFLAGAGDLN